MDFVPMLHELLITEFQLEEDEANTLINTYPYIVMQGIMKGSFALRATAFALQQAQKNVSCLISSDEEKR